MKLPNKKGFAPIIIVLLVTLVAVGGIYFYQIKKGNNAIPIPNLAPKKAEFQDYSNQTLGFTFKYPTGLNVKQDSEEEFNKRGNGDFRKNFRGYVQYEPGKLLGAVVVLDESKSYDTNPLTVWVFDNPLNLSEATWFGKYWYYPFLWGVFDWESKNHITPDKEATVGGKITKYKIVTYQPATPKYFYLSDNGKMYLFRIIGETGDKILSNFNFLSINKPVDNKNGCKITGCSGQACSDQDTMTTCEYRMEYGCYKNAKCERQTDGQCGWTKTEELTKCLEDKKGNQQDIPQ